MRKPRNLGKSTLFPYTTLFRSRELAFGAGAHECVDGMAAFAQGRNQRPTEVPRPADRKSTRLNSSHGYISHAVFCLKKKNARVTRRLLGGRSSGNARCGCRRTP